MDNIKKIGLSVIIFLVAIAVILMIIFYNMSQSLNTLEKQKESLETELKSINNELGIVNNKIINTNINIDQKITNLNSVKSDIEKLQSGKKVELHDPTYIEVQHFLSRDKTNKIPYNKYSFNCVNFAMEVNNNAEENGIRCVYVGVDLTGVDHACVGFYTTDKGMMYFEPQDDSRVYLKIGRRYLGLGYDWKVFGFELYW